MPKLKPRSRPRRETEIGEMLGATMVALGMSHNELARCLGISSGTLSERKKHIGDMRLSELWALQDLRKRYGLDDNGD